MRNKSMQVVTKRATHECLCTSTLIRLEVQNASYKVQKTHVMRALVGEKG